MNELALSQKLAIALNLAATSDPRTSPLMVNAKLGDYVANLTHRDVIKMRGEIKETMNKLRRVRIALR